MNEMEVKSLKPFGARIVDRLSVELATGPHGLAVWSRDGQFVAVRADVVRQIARLVDAPLNASGLREALSTFVAPGTRPGRRASLEQFAERPRAYTFRAADLGL